MSPLRVINRINKRPAGPMNSSARAGVTILCESRDCVFSLEVSLGLSYLGRRLLLSGYTKTRRRL